MFAGKRVIVVNPAQFGIDQRAEARTGATNEIGLATAGGDLLEDHVKSPRSMTLAASPLGCGTTHI
jgi:hypothetical protein